MFKVKLLVQSERAKLSHAGFVTAKVWLSLNIAATNPNFPCS